MHTRFVWGEGGIPKPGGLWDRAFEDRNREVYVFPSFALFIAQPNQQIPIVGMALATEFGFPEQQPLSEVSKWVSGLFSLVFFLWK